MPVLRTLTRPHPEALPTEHSADTARAESGVAAPAKGRPADPQKYPVRVGPSHIDGLGAFAEAAIPARAKVGEIRGEFVSMAEARARAKAAERETGRIFMIAISDKRAVDASASTDPLRYANHSCVPNLVLKVQQGRVAFYALRDIESGEELSAHYGETHHAGRLVCRCGAPQCRGRL